MWPWKTTETIPSRCPSHDSSGIIFKYEARQFISKWGWKGGILSNSKDTERNFKKYVEISNATVSKKWACFYFKCRTQRRDLGIYQILASFSINRSSIFLLMKLIPCIM